MTYMTESDLRAVLGENLKKYRISKGFSQAKLAEILDISPNFISDIETGKRWLSSDTLVNISKALDVQAYELLRPWQPPADDVSAFIGTYTEKAATTACEAVIRSLENLRKQYIP
jgi:transcriptional regulator with XRE-family HTH domain